MKLNSSSPRSNAARCVARGSRVGTDGRGEFPARVTDQDDPRKSGHPPAAHSSGRRCAHCSRAVRKLTEPRRSMCVMPRCSRYSMVRGCVARRSCSSTSATSQWRYRRPGRAWQGQQGAPRLRTGKWSPLASSVGLATGLQCGAAIPSDTEGRRPRITPPDGGSDLQDPETPSACRWRSALLAPRLPTDFHWGSARRGRRHEYGEGPCGAREHRDDSSL